MGFHLHVARELEPLCQVQGSVLVANKIRLAESFHHLPKTQKYSQCDQEESHTVLPTSHASTCEMCMHVLRGPTPYPAPCSDGAFGRKHCAANREK